jgi:uracil-DNA glycosylase
LIDSYKHSILKAAHPSPFSVSNFFGCKHFSKTNLILQSRGLEPIDWSLE